MVNAFRIGTRSLIHYGDEGKNNKKMKLKRSLGEKQRKYKRGENISEIEEASQ
jgi:hypothetical protein